MKKTLLFAALGLAAATASADYTEYYTVSYDGKEVKNGDFISVTAPEKTENGKSNYETVLKVVVNKGDEDEPTYMEGSFDLFRPAVDKMVGGAQFCSDANCYPVDNNVPGNFGYRSPDQDFDYYAGDEFEYLIHITDIPADDNKFDQVFRVTMNAFTGEVVDVQGNYGFDKIPDTEFVMYLQYCVPELASVEGIDAADDVEPVYYNLQGLKIEKPEHGLVIEKRGNSVKKVIL
ncbi:MAG: hypothetical protein NC201_06970 [Prevotella sp.]|nr:hypothetical protein [Bacteroides sp.]MCM1366970.1 hypothetical protein [Prevotella sp.]MCM1437479.1 hypothetical protein [Prevotella sp.]